MFTVQNIQSNAEIAYKTSLFIKFGSKKINKINTTQGTIHATAILPTEWSWPLNNNISK